MDNKKRFCIDCGISVSGNHTKRRPACAQAHIVIYSRQRNKERKPPKRADRHCADCGVTLTRRYCIRCDECRGQHKKQYHSLYEKKIRSKRLAKQRANIALLSVDELTILKRKIKEYQLKNKERLTANRHLKHPPRRKQTEEERGKKRREQARCVYLKRKALGKVSSLRKRYLKNPQVKIGATLRARMWSALQANRDIKYFKFSDVVGCSIRFLKQHLENQFAEGMSWDNYGRAGWHIDHIKPCASFDLIDPEEQKRCFHYTNLQPLWALDNIKKGSKIIN